MSHSSDFQGRQASSPAEVSSALVAEGYFIRSARSERGLLLQPAACKRGLPVHSKLVLIAMLGLVPLVGCRRDYSSVSGKLTIDGVPLAGSENVGVTVMFYPAKGGGAPASAMTDSRGKYVLATGAKRGLAPGEYAVIVSGAEVIPPKSEGAMPTRKMLTPARYADPTQSGFRVDVKPGRNTFDFELTSDEKS